MIYGLRCDNLSMLSLSLSPPFPPTPFLLPWGGRERMRGVSLWPADSGSVSCLFCIITLLRRRTCLARAPPPPVYPSAYFISYTLRPKPRRRSFTTTTTSSCLPLPRPPVEVPLPNTSRPTRGPLVGPDSPRYIILIYDTSWLYARCDTLVPQRPTYRRPYPCREYDHYGERTGATIAGSLVHKGRIPNEGWT